MPGLVDIAVSAATLPISLSSKFTESHAVQVLVNEYHDGTTQRTSLVTESQRTWKLTKRLTPVELVAVPRKRRIVPYIQSLVPATEPNQVWCMDFKGSFECGNGERCDTFTVTDAFSRFVLHCQAIK